MSKSLRFAVIGAPVAHSRSPQMHTAAYRALQLPHAYEKIETTESELPARIEALRRGELDGLNVTVPHKARALELADEVDPSARATGAANTLVRTTGGRVRAHNTDAPALAEELRLLAGDAGRFVGRTAMVLGTGGAAQAATFALGTLGVGRVVVRGRRDNPELARSLAASGSRAEVRFEPIGETPTGEPSDLVAIVQATTAGMHGGPPGAVVADAVAWATVPRDCVVLDAVYAPPRTPLLERAAKEGLANACGLGMLVRQGALAFELWLGVAPPLDVMASAIA